MAQGELFYSLFLVGHSKKFNKEKYNAQIEAEPTGQILTNLLNTFNLNSIPTRMRAGTTGWDPVDYPPGGAPPGDNSLKGHCVQLVRYIIGMTVGNAQCFPPGDARLWATNTVPTHLGFTRYAFRNNNIINVMPLSGDIFVWDATGNNPHGHIGFLRDQIHAPEHGAGEYKLISARTIDQNRTNKRELDSRVQNFSSYRLTALIRHIGTDSTDTE